MPRSLARAVLLAALVALPVHAGEIATSVDSATLATSKQTPLGLHLTAADAHAALQADPGIVFLDVRDPIEIVFVGHAQGVDAVVPLKVATHRFNPERGVYAMVENKDFVAQVDAILAREGRTRTDPVFLICRSGGRSADAVKALVAAGYTNAWNLVDGFEGDMNKETGTRDRNGWRNAGLPFAYKLEPAQAWTPAGQ